MNSSYINIYNLIKNYKLSDETVCMIPGAIISVAIVVYCNIF